MSAAQKRRVARGVCRPVGETSMTVDALPTPVRVRMFRVTFRPNLDGPESDDIPLGVFGDLRMGERYAVGLIARSAGEHAEVTRVGRLAKVVVARPYDALQQM